MVPKNRPSSFQRQSMTPKNCPKVKPKQPSPKLKPKQPKRQPMAPNNFPKLKPKQPFPKLKPKQSLTPNKHPLAPPKQQTKARPTRTLTTASTWRHKMQTMF